jgi:uncharacterized protein YjbK
MVQLNRPVTTREFKLMLNTKDFKDREKGIQNFSNFIETQIEHLNATEELGQARFEKELKEKERRTWYLDTRSFELNKHKFLLRIRYESTDDEYVTDLKCRNPDRYIAASYDLSSTLKDDVKTKFEEDIVPQFTSKFSLSASFKMKEEPELRSIRDLKAIFPGLNRLGIGEGQDLKKVNSFEAREISCKIGEIKFKEGKTDDVSLSFWYLPNEGRKEIPVITEFAFDYNANGQKNANESLSFLEEFPNHMVRGTNAFYLSLQKEKFVDLKVAKTKTEYAYEYKT